MSLDLTVYAEVDEFNSGGYEWTTTRLYTRAGRVFAITRSGCSCNDFSSSPVRESDLIELPTLDAAGWHYTNNHGYHGANWFNVIDRFRILGLR